MRAILHQYHSFLHDELFLRKVMKFSLIFM